METLGNPVFEQQTDNKSIVSSMMLVRHTAPIKSEDKILKKCLQQRDEICTKNTLECTKLHRFFKKIPELPPPSSIA